MPNQSEWSGCQRTTCVFMPHDRSQRALKRVYHLRAEPEVFCEFIACTVTQDHSPLRRTSQPESIDSEAHHSRRSMVSYDAEQDPLDRETVARCVDDTAAAEENASLPGWLSTVTGSTASWQLPPEVVAPGRSPRLLARSSVLSPGPLRFSYREAAAASVARRAAARQGRAASSPRTVSGDLCFACPPLEACEVSPEPCARAGRRAPEPESVLQRASADAAVARRGGDGNGSSPVSLRKRFGGFRACESLPAGWPSEDMRTSFLA